MICMLLSPIAKLKARQALAQGQEKSYLSVNFGSI